MLQLQPTQPNSKPHWLVAPVYVIGSNSDCNIVVHSSSVQSHHARLDVEGETVRLINLVGDQNVRVNGVPVMKDARSLTTDDVISVGTAKFKLVDSRHIKTGSTVEEEASVERWELKPMGAALAGREFVLRDDVTIVGRAKDCDIALGIAHLSRKHARLEITAHGLQVEDLNSANGTFVNGLRIEKAIVRPGDTVRFDSIDFCVAGPHQDTDLTTVRPVLRVAGANAHQAPLTQQTVERRPRPHPSQVARSRQQSVPPASMASARVESGGGLIHEKPHRSMVLAAWGLAGLVSVALIWFVLH